MKMVESPWVSTIAFTVPNPLAVRGAARVAMPIRMSETPMMGPLSESGIPYWR